MGAEETPLVMRKRAIADFVRNLQYLINNVNIDRLRLGVPVNKHGKLAE